MIESCGCSFREVIKIIYVFVVYVLEGVISKIFVVENWIVDIVGNFNVVFLML